VMAEETPSHGFNYSLNIAVPPLAFVMFKR